MADPLGDKLVIGISTRALFDLDEANAIFEKDGLEPYRDFEREHEQDVLSPGTGFRLVEGLLKIRSPITGDPLVEVILLSRNDPDSSMRVFNSIEAHNLAITRGAFRGGRDPWPFLPAFRCELFLSAEPAAVQKAIAEGTAAGLVLRPPEVSDEATPDEVLIAFDGDSVLFNEESDRIYDDQGPVAYFKHEKDNADVPLSPGPFRPFLERLGALQAQFPERDSPIRTALVTARNAPAHRRVVNTFRSWNVRVDEAYFLGGIDKAEILSRLRPHIFFDDQMRNLEGAAGSVPSAHVPALEGQLPLFVPATTPDGSKKASKATVRAIRPGARQRRTDPTKVPAAIDVSEADQPVILDEPRSAPDELDSATLPAEDARIV